MIARTLQDMFKRYRRPGDLVFAAAFLAFSILLVSQIGTQTQVTDRTKWFAQPALWPTISLSVMLGFAALHFLSSALSPRIAGRWREVVLWFRGLEYVAYFLVYVMTVPYLGYLPTTILFCIFLTLRTGFRGVQPIFYATLFGVAVTLIFRAFLSVRIPAGAVYEYLPDGIRAIAVIYL